MNRKATIKIVIATACLVVLSFTLYGYTSSFGESHEEIVKRYWQFALENKVDEADALTASENAIKYGKLPSGFSGVGSATTHLDGSKIDWVYRKEIYKSQIKIIRATEFKKSGYRSGVRLETVDKDERKLEFIACLGESEADSSWKVVRVTLSNVYDKPETIEDECFEKD